MRLRLRKHMLPSRRSTAVPVRGTVSNVIVVKAPAPCFREALFILRDEYLDQVKGDGDYSVSFVFAFDLYYNTLRVDTRNYTYAHTDDTMYEVSAEKPAVFDRYALPYSAYGTDYSRHGGYSNAFFSGWANINMESKVWSGFYIDLNQVRAESVSGTLDLVD